MSESWAKFHPRLYACRCFRWDGMGWDQKQVHAGTASQPFMTSSFVPADFVEQLLSSNFTVAHVQTSLSTPALYLRHWHCFSAFLPLFPTIIVCNQIWWTAQPDLDLATWSQLYEYRELGAKLWRTVMHIYRVYSKRDIRRKEKKLYAWDYYQWHGRARIL